MNILDQIVADKEIEVELRKKLIPIEQLEQSVLFDKAPISLVQNLKSSSSGIIAEFKRCSPSKSIINQDLNIYDVAKGYEKAGVCGMSVLTDGKYFGGSLDDLLTARASCKLPLLRKEFVIDPYQIIEAKAYGANVILLIAAILSKEELKAYTKLAQSLELEVLMEVHDETELKKALFKGVNMIGVNNRNLKTFEVSLETSKKLSALIPDDFVKVSESGISDAEAIRVLRSYGYQGFLIGENFMKTDNAGESAQLFIQELKP